jgi:hypothetical protein
MTIPKTRALVTTTAPRVQLPEHHRRAIRRGNVSRSLGLGNTNALRFGVYAQVAIHEDVLDEAALLFARAPWLDEVRDGVLVEATARVIVRLRKLDAAIETEPTAVLTSLYRSLEAQLTRNLDALGLTPTAAARLGITALQAQQRAQRIAERALEAYRPGPEETTR